ncbi:MAG: aminopeptidase [Cyanobacteria bacterium J083]|nr:MAG: aminopeptidase [Cyanobacteria bacterium J083]
MLKNYFDTEENERRSFELPGAKPHYNPDRPGQVNHIFLDLDLDIPQQSLTGTCNITLTPVRPGITSLTLDAVNQKIESVLIAGVSQPFDYDEKQLKVNLLQPTTTEKFTISISYRVEKPQRGIYFIQPDEYYPDKPIQVWTQGEDEDSRFWFPGFDYPGQLSSSEIKIRVAKPYIAVSNGQELPREDLGEKVAYHWLQEQVHPTYLITLAVGDFAVIEDSWQNIPILYYVEKGKEAEAKRSMGKTPQMMEFLSNKYGYPYPYPKYAQVCVDDFIFGGMENTSTTLLTDRCLLDEKASIDNERTESLVLHELAHQWFGDLVVIKHWSHAWIKEGMASYAEVSWTEHEYGKQAGAYYLLREARNYLEEDSSRYRRPIVTNVYREAIELYDRHLYEKGACVYHMIRGILGEELFDRAITTFVNDNAHQTVETVDLLRAIDKATGYNLAYLFDQYVFRGGHPEYKVAYNWDNENNLATLTVTQTQAKDDSTAKDNQLFDLKIPLAFAYLTNSQVEYKKFKLQIARKQQSFYFPLDKKPDFVCFDLNNNFLKTVTLEYPLKELTNQLKHDPDPIARIYAATALGKKGGIEIVKTLGEALTTDEFWGVRGEIAKQLGKIKLNQAEKTLTQGLEDSDPRVRREVVSALAEFKTPTSYTTVKDFLAKESQSYYTEAAAAKALGSLVTTTLKDKQAEVIAILQNILQTKAGWNEVVRAGAINGLSAMTTSKEAVDTILEYTKLGTPQPLRLAAIRALGAVSVGQETDKVEEILKTLETIGAESFFLTQVAVASALGQMQTSQAITLLQSLADQTPDGRVKRMAEEAITKVQKKIGSDKAVKELREEIDKLKQENQELNSRIAKLEAKE